MDWALIQIIVTIVFGVVAVVSIIVALKLAKRKKPVWACRTRHITGREAEAPPELRLIFGDKEVADVYKTIVVFFNRGNDVIHASDVKKNIAIHFKNAEILKQPTIRKFSRSGNSFSAKQAIRGGDHIIEFGFEYLGHNDGAVIEVWHTKTNNPCHSGEIENVDITKLKEFVASRPEGFRGGLVVVTAVIVMFILLWWETASSAFETGVDWSEVVPYIAFTAIFAVFLVFNIRHLFRYRAFPRWSRLVK